MRIAIERTGAEDFVMGAWTDAYGPHENTEYFRTSMPAEVKAHLAAFLDWVEGTAAPGLVGRERNYQEAREIDRDIEKLQRRRKELLGR